MGGFESSGGWTEVPSTIAGDATSFWRGYWGIADEYAGSWSYTISNVSYGWLYSDEVPVVGGAKYVAEVSMRGKVDADTSLSTTWVVRVYWYDSSGAYIKKSNAAVGARVISRRRGW